MSDQPPPQKPKGPRMSHLHMDPIPMSFASPQQLAQLTSGGSLFPQQRMKAPPPSHAPRMSAPPPQPVHHAHSAASAGNKEVPSSPSGQPQPAAARIQNVLKPLPAQAIDLNGFKGFKFVTLDALQSETRSIYEQISGAMYWTVCEGQAGRCVNEIRDNLKDRRVFLITSGSLGSTIVPQLHELPQLYAIYVYCADIKRHQEWAKDFAKVRVVCNNDDKDLLPLFAVDVAQANIDWADALLKSGAHSKAKEKLELALDKLMKHAPNHDPGMEAEIKAKLLKGAHVH